MLAIGALPPEALTQGTVTAGGPRAYDYKFALGMQ
jgi:hypothetical protein